MVLSDRPVNNHKSPIISYRIISLETQGVLMLLESNPWRPMGLFWSNLDNMLFVMCNPRLGLCYQGVWGLGLLGTVNILDT